MGKRCRGVVVVVGLVAMLAAAPAASALRLYVVADAVYPVDTATSTVENGIPTEANAIAITPDGRTAYVTGADDLTPIDLATGALEPAIAVGHPAEAIAISPDGGTAFVRNPDGVTPIDLATQTAGAMIPAAGAPSDGLGGPSGIAVTPNGRTVYVSDNTDGTVIPIDVATRTAGTPIPVPSGPDGIAVTPNGTTAYVISASPINSPARVLTPIDTTTNTAGTPIPLNVAATQFAITPDGRTAYVWTWSRQLVAVDLATRTVDAPLGGDSLAGSTGQVVISPDGVFADAMGDICETGCTGIGFVFDLGSGAETDFTGPNGGFLDPWIPVAAAFVPGPAAAFSSTQALAGQATSFDATGSADPGGQVGDYHWSFGDGSQATSSSPAITHIYSRAGTYSVTLTTDNAGGCAARFIFTGQTASCSGSPTAQTSRPVTIAAAAPSAAITAPRSGRTFVSGETVPTRFACQEGTGGPGLTSCTDSNHAHVPSGHLNTGHTGAHTYAVTATSNDGLHATARITYTVVAAARHPITIHTARATVRHRRIRIRLSCSARWPSGLCRGTLILRIAARSGRHAHIRTVGKRSYAIPRGTARTLTIALDTATLTLLEQHGSHGRIHVRANATIRRGRASTRTISLQAA